MTGHTLTRPARLLAALLLAATLLGGALPARSQEPPRGMPQPAAAPAHTIYLPAIQQRQAPSIFGFEAYASGLGDSRVFAQAQNLGASWIRMNKVSWRQVQPEQGQPYNWAAMAEFERELARARQLKLEPVVIVDDYPRWATVVPSSCAAIKDEAMPAYAAFLEALAGRYKDQVRYWELGNEPDVDPTLVAADNVFGCWGDIADPYYGGERYGRMLQAVAPAIRRANPRATIVFGGLLLDSPNSTNPSRGKPEKFLEGALRAGAGASFDVLAYHAYPSYPNFLFDPDQIPSGGDPSVGTRTLWKILFLRDVMQRYGVDKPLWLNETSYLCTPSYADCATPKPEFFQNQADFLVRTFARVASYGVQQISWFTLNGPGWRSSSLLNSAQAPQPSFVAYRHLIQRVSPYYSIAAVSYGATTESYRFNRGPELVDVVWSRSTEVQTVQVPIAKFVRLYGRDGQELAVRQGSDAMTVEVRVGFQPVYIVRNP